MVCMILKDKDNRSLICNGLCSCIDHRKCIKFMVVNTCNVYCLVALEDDFGIVAKYSIPPFAPRSTNVPLLLCFIACLDACILLGPYLDFRFFLGLLVATLLTLHSNLSLECWSVVSEGTTHLSILVGSDTQNSPSVSSLILLAFESKEDLTLIWPW